MNMEEKIAIITVVYNNYQVLTDFFASLDAQEDREFFLYLVDTSTDKQDIQNLKIPYQIINAENKGYANAINVALKKAIESGYHKFCLINDDVYFNNDFLSQVKRAFGKYPGTVFGGMIYYAAGYEYHRDRYQDQDRGSVIWYGGGQVDWEHATTRHLKVDELDDKKSENQIERRTDFITGCLVCFDKSVFEKVGFWDESYFLYYEDADFCERAKKKKIPLMHLPSIKIWHKNAQSTDGSGSKLHEKYQKKSQLKFALKYAPFRTKIHVLLNYLLR